MAVEVSEVVSVDDPEEKERIRKELEAKDKKKKYHAEYYQRNKEKMDARAKANRKKKEIDSAKQSAEKTTFAEVAEELKELEEVKKTVTLADEEITTTKEEITTTKEEITTNEEVTKIVMQETTDQKDDVITVQLTSSQAAELRALVEGYIWDNSRESLDMEYLCTMCGLWKKLKF